MSLFRNITWFLKGLKEYTKGGYEAAAKKFNPADLDVSVSNRSFMITGANSGVGRCTALAIAKKGGTVHMVCRSKERGEEALKDLQEKSGNTNIHLHLVDLSRPKAIREFVEKFRSNGTPLNVLINNAGVLVSGDQRTLTEDGLETTFATNTLGVHILTTGLVPVLENSEDPRVIIVTSGGMLVQKLDLSDLQFEKMRKFDGTMAYSQTKRQEVVMTTMYAKEYPKVHFSTCHPGWADTAGVRSSLPDFHAKMKDRLRTEEQGADVMLWLAVAPSASKQPSGLFFQDREPVSTHLPLAWTKSSPAEDQKLMDILQEMSQKF
ncbi:hypothetical protein EGW08_006817 [Elysia chlorotica]|uniref:Dehydrogenase/reductase SDR family member 12 n=1 Tax=Elysia chlorotica TaxID=188477 RepID=A0A433TV15_ELYCH|nr:hypothetical protein EGW08_006817 [Elysia chlorotica]